MIHRDTKPGNIFLIRRRFESSIGNAPDPPSERPEGSGAGRPSLLARNMLVKTCCLSGPFVLEVQVDTDDVLDRAGLQGSTKGGAKVVRCGHLLWYVRSGGFSRVGGQARFTGGKPALRVVWLALCGLARGELRAAGQGYAASSR